MKRAQKGRPQMDPAERRRTVSVRMEPEIERRVREVAQRQFSTFSSAVNFLVSRGLASEGKAA